MLGRSVLYPADDERAAQKSKAARFPNRASPTPTEVRELYYPSGHGTLNSAPGKLEPQLTCSDGHFGLKSLHKDSRLREFGRQAGLAHVRPCGGPQGAKEQTRSYFDTSSLLPSTEHVRREDPITPPQKPRLCIEASSSEESVEEAVLAPKITVRDVTLTSSQQLTTVASPSKPRLISISARTSSSQTSSSQPATPFKSRPALVSAFSPDTPPETPDVANRIDAYEIPTHPTVGKHGHRSLDSKIYYPTTRPNSRVPTPFGRFTSSSCFRNRPRWGHPTMAQIDPATAWILQELEVLLADYPITALRLDSPVIEHIRSVTSGPPAHDRSSPRHRSSTAPHSRYSPYKPVIGFSATAAPSLLQDLAPQVTHPSLNTCPDSTAFALRTVFPSAHPHHLESLHATYIAIHYVVKFPSSEFGAISAFESAASPYATSAKRSRCSSVISNVPPKARAMLGLESPAQTSPLLPSPARSWYGASTPELDPELRMRLANVELLLETSVRRILADVEGLSLGKQDDALGRAVAEIVKLGEKSLKSGLIVDGQCSCLHV
ncbi:MAG: hypothetical protein Q9208_000714 [Pyrenodesmia sp. 3 TL-2023]